MVPDQSNSLIGVKSYDPCQWAFRFPREDRLYQQALGEGSMSPYIAYSTEIL